MLSRQALKHKRLLRQIAENTSFKEKLTQGMNITDTWRLEGGRIVEHWDSIQALDVFMRLYSLMSGGTIRNSNGVF